MIRMRTTRLAMAAASLLSLSATAHGPLHEQIDGLTRRIESAPDDATLYLRRGELRREHRDTEAALSDFARAGRLDPSLAQVDLLRGKTLLDAGLTPAAIAALDRFLAARPDHADALAARARAHAVRGDSQAAARDYTLAIRHAAPPEPDHYLGRARALAAEGGESVSAAIRGLDEGIARLGPLVSLTTTAIEIEQASGRNEAALARLNRLIDGAPRPETWLARRAELLAGIGRSREAAADCLAALAAIERLPQRVRDTRSSADLEARLREMLRNLPASG